METIAQKKLTEGPAITQLTNIFEYILEIIPEDASNEIVQILPKDRGYVAKFRYESVELCVEYKEGKSGRWLSTAALGYATETQIPDDYKTGSEAHWADRIVDAIGDIIDVRQTEVEEDMIQEINLAWSKVLNRD